MRCKERACSYGWQWSAGGCSALDEFHTYTHRHGTETYFWRLGRLDLIPIQRSRLWETSVLGVIKTSATYYPWRLSLFPLLHPEHKRPAKSHAVSSFDFRFRVDYILACAQRKRVEGASYSSVHYT
jgi:hypothetical protein